MTLAPGRSRGRRRSRCGVTCRTACSSTPATKATTPCTTSFLHRAPPTKPARLLEEFNEGDDLCRVRVGSSARHCALALRAGNPGGAREVPRRDYRLPRLSLAEDAGHHEAGSRLDPLGTSADDE